MNVEGITLEEYIEWCKELEKPKFLQEIYLNDFLNVFRDFQIEILVYKKDEETIIDKNDIKLKNCYMDIDFRDGTIQVNAIMK